MDTKNEIEKLSTKDLEIELKKRKEAEKLAAIPKPLQNPDFTELITMVTHGINSLAKNGYPGKDFDHYVYENALEAVYGKEIWDWINNREREQE